MAYATVEELEAWLDPEPAPDNATKLLDRASRRVDSALVGAIYATDEDGQPTDAAAAAAMRDAACAQVEWWIETGDTTGTGAGAGWRSVSIGSLSLSRSGNGTSTSSDVGGGGSGTPLAPTAAEILHLAGLLPIFPWVWG